MNPLGLLTSEAGRELEYRSYVAELAAREAPDVAILGSSRAANGVIVSELQTLLARGGVRATVGAYSLSGGRAEETLFAMERARDAARLPRVWVWALTPLELGARAERPSLNATYLWRLPDWWRERRELHARADAYLPGVLLNEVARFSWVVRSRFVLEPAVVASKNENPWPALRGALAPRDVEPTFMQGALHEKHRGSERLTTRLVTEKWAKSYNRKAFQGTSALDGYQARHLEAAADFAAKAGVRLLFLELPTSPQLEKTMPRGALHGFRNFVTTVAHRHGFQFVAVEHMRLVLVAEDTRDGSHLGYRGAKKVTTAAAPFVAAELEKAFKNGAPRKPSTPM